MLVLMSVRHSIFVVIMVNSLIHASSKVHTDALTLTKIEDMNFVITRIACHVETLN